MALQHGGKAASLDPGPAWESPSSSRQGLSSPGRGAEACGPPPAILTTPGRSARVRPGAPGRATGAGADGALCFVPCCCLAGNKRGSQAAHRPLCVPAGEALSPRPARTPGPITSLPRRAPWAPSRLPLRQTPKALQPGEAWPDPLPVSQEGPRLRGRGAPQRAWTVLPVQGCWGKPWAQAEDSTWAPWVPTACPRATCGTCMHTVMGGRGGPRHTCAKPGCRHAPTLLSPDTLCRREPCVLRAPPTQ